VRSDVEVRQWRAALPAALAVGQERFAGDESGLIRQRFAVEVGVGQCVIEVLDP
jgi:hypothetical protein